MKRKYWTSEEIKYLIESYPRVHMEKMILKLNRSENSIKYKARDLKLKRDLSFLRSGKRHYRWNGGKQEFVCENCGSIVLRYPKTIGKYIFCSSKCHYIWKRNNSNLYSGKNHNNWKGGKTLYNIQRNCFNCNEKFITTEKHIQNGWGKYCSYSCRMIITKKKQTKKFTNIEKMTYKFLLSKYGLSFYPQYYIKGYGIADFYNPRLRIIIECHGDYWHNLNIVREKDRIKEQFALDAGYQLVVLSGSEIREKFQ